MSVSSKKLYKNYEEDLSKELEKSCKVSFETKTPLEQKSDNSSNEEPKINEDLNIEDKFNSDLNESTHKKIPSTKPDSKSSTKPDSKSSKNPNKESDSDSDSSPSEESDSDLDNDSYVINPINIDELDIDIKKLKKMVSDYMLPRIDYYKSTETKNLVIESYFSEWWIEKASNGQKIGNGNSPFDVITCQNNGIDVMCLCINGNQSNEKSIIQNFKNSGNNLDNYFKNKKYDDAIKIFINDYKKKIIEFKSKKNCDNLYYLSFISTSEHIYLSAFKININNLEHVISNGSTIQAKSIHIKNFINDKYGYVKLYKSKKRIELRFFKNILKIFNTIIIY
jgi:hypothetical protein